MWSLRKWKWLESRAQEKWFVLDRQRNIPLLKQKGRRKWTWKSGEQILWQKVERVCKCQEGERLLITCKREGERAGSEDWRGAGDREWLAAARTQVRAEIIHRCHTCSPAVLISLGVNTPRTPCKAEVLPGRCMYWRDADMENRSHGKPVTVIKDGMGSLAG